MRSLRLHWLGRRSAICLVSALAVSAVMLGGGSAAWAQDGGVGAGAVPQFPPTVTVGAQDVPVSLLLVNNSTGEYADDTFSVDQITLTPSCGSKLGFGVCPVGAEDPGVFVPSPTGVGRAGTSCAGQVFNIALLDPATGRYLFTPTTPVTLGPTGTAAGSCVIDFTVDVARAPAKDSDPAQPGLQTDQYASVSITDITPGNTFGQSGAGVGFDETTVLRATPTVVTQVNDATITVGESFTDTATIGVPAGAPAPTGTVNFFVYGPDDATCAGAPVASSLTRPVGAGGTATSDVFTPSVAGTYRVIAVYSGDATYLPASGQCNDPGETVVVARAQPAIATQATNATVGQPIGDTATVTGLVNPVSGAGAGTVTFRLYSDAACANQIFVSNTRPLNLTTPTSGTATSEMFAPANTGQYFWRAFYSGDQNNAPVSGVCGAAGETSTIAPAQLAIATQATNATVGGPIGDTATVTGLVNPVSGAGAGTVTFRLYSDAACANQIFVSSNRPVNFNSSTSGTATSETFTPVHTGNYFWRAFYSGDRNNAPVSGACGAVGETSTVTPNQPAIATQAAPTSVQLGQGTLTDTATVSGLVNPVTGAGAGTVTFTLYGPNDPGCTTPRMTASGRPLTLTGAGTTGTATSGVGFTPPAAGTYSWVASYTGDANNAPVSGACGDVNEQTVVTVPPPPPPPPCTEDGAVTQTNQGTIEQGGNTATGGNAAAGGGDGGDASSANTVTDNDGDTETESGDARGGGGGDATGIGGEATASNTATQTMQNRCGGDAADAEAARVPDVGGAAASGAVAAGAPDAVGSPAARPGTAGTPDPASYANFAPQPLAPLPFTHATTRSGSTQQVESAATPARDTAAISGATGCQNVPFNVVVSGRRIARVTFALDGKGVRTLTRPNSGRRYQLLVKPRNLRNGQHRVLARVRFRPGSATPTRTLRVVFSRCAAGAR